MKTSLRYFIWKKRKTEFDTCQILQNNQFTQLYEQSFNKGHSWTAVTIVKKILKLYPDQIKTWKKRCIFNIVALLIYKLQQRWSKKDLAIVLFMDVKKAFNHVSKTQLIAQMLELEIDGDLIYKTKTFLTNQKLQLVIDNYNN